MESIARSASRIFQNLAGWGRPVGLGIAIAMAAGCGDAHLRLITPQNIQPEVEWTDQERADPFARRLVHSEAGSSTHVLLLRKEEGSHVHDTHDRTLIVASGSGWARLGARNVRYGPGDVITIPRGSAHALENTAEGGSEFFEIFAPAYDGKDWRAVKEGAH